VFFAVKFFLKKEIFKTVFKQKRYFGETKNKKPLAAVLVKRN
jgi:hypothetical protein